jgi:hypothetical protein
MSKLKDRGNPSAAHIQFDVDSIQFMVQFCLREIALQGLQGNLFLNLHSRI